MASLAAFKSAAATQKAGDVSRTCGTSPVAGCPKNLCEPSAAVIPTVLTAAASRPYPGINHRSADGVDTECKYLVDSIELNAAEGPDILKQQSARKAERRIIPSVLSRDRFWVSFGRYHLWMLGATGAAMEWLDSFGGWQGRR